MDESEEQDASPKADEASLPVTERTSPTSEDGATMPAEHECPDDDERDTIPVSRRSIRPAASESAPLALPESAHPPLATEVGSQPAPAMAVDASGGAGSAAAPAVAIAETAAELVEPVPVPAVTEPTAPAAASEQPPPPVAREEPSATVASEVSPPLVVGEQPDAALAPMLEMTSSVAANVLEVADAGSMSAQVVPIRPGAGLPVAPVKTESRVEKGGARAEPTTSRRYLWMLAGAAALAALWLSSREGGTDQGEVPLIEEPAAASEHAAVSPADQPEATPAPDSSMEPSAELSDATPVLLAQAKAVEADASERMQPAPKLAAPEAEPARLTAYKAVMHASQEARNCRYRGDVAGKIPIVVEFGTDGRVQRTQAKGTFANPMTNRCIVSKFSGLTISSAAPGPIIVTANVSLR